MSCLRKAYTPDCARAETGGLTVAEYMSREAAIAYIREQSEECQKAFEELGGESGIYADAYNDLAEDFYSIPTADVAPVVHGLWEKEPSSFWRWTPSGAVAVARTTYRCGLCGRGTAVKSNYCPNCGAKMDGGNENV